MPAHATREAPEQQPSEGEILLSFMRSLDARMSDLASRFVDHMGAEEGHYKRINAELRNLSEKVQTLNRLHEAFPELDDGTPDIQGHRNDHEVRLEEALSSRRFWQRMKESLMEKIITAVAIAALVLLGLGATSWMDSWLEHREARGHTPQVEATK